MTITIQFNFNVVHSFDPTTLSLLENFMATLADFTAPLADMTAKVDTIVTEIQALKDKIAAGGLTADEEQQVLDQLTALSGKISDAAAAGA